MLDGKLRRELNACAKKTEIYHVSEFSIAHRGAPLQFPEHTFESIALFKRFGVKMTPELKTPVVQMPFDGMTQEAYAQKVIDEYKAAGIPPSRVFAQSFLKDDILYWSPTIRASPGRPSISTTPTSRPTCRVPPT